MPTLQDFFIRGVRISYNQNERLALIIPFQPAGYHG
jgi:hypothetical protein